MNRSRSSRFASRRSRGRRTRGNYSRRLAYEPLEDRRLLALWSVFNDITNTLYVNLNAANDEATIRVDGSDIKIWDTTGAGDIPSPGVDTVAAANVDWIQVIGTAAVDSQSVIIDGPLTLQFGLLVEDSVEEAHINASISGSQASAPASGVIIRSPDIWLGADILTDGGNVELAGNVTLLGLLLNSVRVIDTDFGDTPGNAGKDAGNVTISGTIDTSVGLLFPSKSLTIDARADGGGDGGWITLVDDVGTPNPLRSLALCTSSVIDLAANPDLEIHTDGGVDFHASILRTKTSVTGLYIDTESGGDSDGGDVALDVGLVVEAWGWPGIIRVNTLGGVDDQAGTVSLPPGFHQIGQAADWVTYEDTRGSMDIFVAQKAVDATGMADFGDAPDSYGTALADDGARHLVTNNSLYLGTKRDNEQDGPAAGTGVQDDNTAEDDEDGVVLPAYLTAGREPTVQVTLSEAGFLDAWVDFNRDGDFFEAADQVFASLALTPGTHDLTFPVPAGLTDGDTYARFRVSSTGGLAPFGLAVDGEVEDYAVEIGDVEPTMDFGDAPNDYDTMAGVDGPRHTTTGNTLYLGAARDAEDNGQPNATATGDDTAGVDDEDGVTIPALVVGTTVPVQVVASEAGGRLDAWIDYDGDRRFDDPGDNPEEQVITNRAVVAGNNSINVTVPADATPGTTFARFRLSSAGGLTPGGALPVADGEVEDYQVTIQPAAAPGAILFEEDFDDLAVDPRLVTQTGNFALSGPEYAGNHGAAGGTEIATINGIALPAHYRVEATVNTGGGNGSSLWSNGLVIFDYVDANNFKYAGAFEIRDEFIIGQVSGGTMSHLVARSSALAPGVDINLSLEINGSTATLSAGGVVMTTYNFGALSGGRVGIGALNADTVFDNIVVTQLA